MGHLLRQTNESSAATAEDTTCKKLFQRGHVAKNLQPHHHKRKRYMRKLVCHISKTGKLSDRTSLQWHLSPFSDTKPCGIGARFIPIGYNSRSRQRWRWNSWCPSLSFSLAPGRGSYVSLWFEEWSFSQHPPANQRQESLIIFAAGNERD